ncbi:MAG: estB [Frankiales bacterium]|nr:estB [Frankiales bacterium]
MLTSLAPARRRLVRGASIALVLVVAVVVGLLVVRSQRSSDGPAAAVAQDHPGPILLVPGYGGATSALTVLATKLAVLGRVTEVVQLPGGGTGDLNQQAKTLDAAARKLLSRTGASTVDVIGYSAGGVVTRIWLRDLGGAKLTRRVVTLGSPQHGTALAGLAAGLLPGACPLACQQLEASSTVLAALNAGAETPAGPTFVSIWSSHDDVVLPPESAVLAGALNLEVQNICPASTVNHANLPTDPLVEAIVSRELAAGPPVPLGAPDCAALS